MRRMTNKRAATRRRQMWPQMPNSELPQPIEQAAGQRLAGEKK